MTSFDAQALRNTLGRFATGVTIVTTVDAQGNRYGITANSYNSVSLDPPLVLWSLARMSRSLEAFANAPAFAIHILSANQEELARRFAARDVADKFAGLHLREGHGGVPLFDDCAAHLECVTENRFEGGDHVIFLGRVVNFERGDIEPLIFHDGRFTRVSPKGPDA